MEISLREEKIPQEIIDSVSKDEMLSTYTDLGQNTRRIAIYLDETIIGFFSPKTKDYNGKTYFRTGAIYILPQYRNRGYGTLCIDAYFKDKSLGITFIEPRNISSIRAFEKCGFVKEKQVIGKINGEVFWMMLKEPKRLEPAFLNW